MIKKDLMIGVVILIVIAIINSQEVAENVMPSSVEPSIIIQSVSPQVVPELKVQQNIINKPQNTQKTQNINTSSQTIQKEQQPILTSQSNITANNTPTNQISPKRNELVDQTIDHLANLSKLHQQAMLQQVNILHKIHQNPSLSLQNLANTTQDQMLDAERKFAHQSRLNYEKVKRQIEQNQLRIRKQDQQLLRSAKLTKTNQFKLQQKTTFQDTYNKWRDTQTNHNLSDYMFSITKDRTEDFMVMLPVDQIIYVTIAIYVNKNGVYSRTVDIQDEGPLHVLIYENNNRIIEEKQVYFQSNFYIQGKQNKIYTIKFNNYDIDRLIAFSISVLLQHNHVSQVISAHDVSNHDDRVDSVLQDIQTRFNALNDIETLQYTNIETLKQRIAQYYNYAIVQTIIIIIFGFIQVQLMSRLLKKSSVI